MIVLGTIITPAQRSAGIEVMHGEFRAGKVTQALRQAGVSTKDGLVAEAALRLIQHQQALGKVKRVGMGLYRGARVH